MLEVYICSTPISGAHGNFTPAIAISLSYTRSEKNRPLIVPQVKQNANSGSSTLVSWGISVQTYHLKGWNERVCWHYRKPRFW